VAAVTATTDHTTLETHVTVSGPSDIIGGVGLDVATSRLVGRDQEAGSLAQLLGIGTPDERGMVLLSGDAGIGKTRLLGEVAGRARDQGWTVLVGHCLGEAGQSMPYLPFSEMLTRLEAADPSSVERTMSAHSALAALFPARRRRAPEPELDAPDTIDPRDLVEAAHAAFEGVSWDAPLLLVVEDVHWADQSSRDLLTLFFTRGFGGRVSIVASYRSDDLHRRHPLRTTLAHWSRLGDLHRVELEPLPDAAVRQLVRGVQPRPLTEHEVRAVVDRAEGNAFFAEELVAASALGRTGVAEDLSRLLLVRFDQLEAAGQHVVRMASAAGRHVSHPLLTAVAGLGDAELDQGLRDAVEHHVLVPTDSGGYAFRHALLAETVYDDLLPGERVRAHERYAAALGSDPSLGTWADIARHASAAGDRAVALDASIHAGDAAMSAGGPEEAWRHYRQALSLIPDHHPDADRLALRASAALTAKGQAIKALALLEERLSRRRLEQDPLGRAEILSALATTARLTESTLDTLAATKEGLGLLEGADLPERQAAQVRARLLGARVQALVDRGRDEEAARAAEEAVEAALAAGLPEVAAEVRVVEARVVERVGDPQTSQDALERIIATGAAPGDPAQVRALHHLGSLHHRLGRLDEAVEVYRRGAEAGRAAGRAWAPYAFDSRLLAGVAAYEVGRWDDSLEILDLTGQDPPQPAEALLRSARLFVVAGRGGADFGGELEAVRRWWEDEGLVAVFAGGAAIDLHGHAGDLRAALAAHDETVEVLTGIWHRHFQAQTRLSALLLGQLGSFVQRVPTTERAHLLSRGRGAVEDAEQVWARVSEMPGQHGPEAQAWIARARAEGLRLRWLGGEQVDPGELADRWREAVAAFDEYGHRYEGARSRARLGAALQAAGDAAASETIQAALATARELGAEPLLAEIRSAGGRTQAAARPADRLGEALTPREQEILALVALGRSNRQIGTQLFISAKTASVHVSNLMAKLGVSGRGEAVAVARARGLLG
jgi:DNA-binding CsgD family transcriptional regulator/tetratricopeptide (TPR) repeat protein